MHYDIIYDTGDFNSVFVRAWGIMLLLSSQHAHTEEYNNNNNAT